MYDRTTRQHCEGTKNWLMSKAGGTTECQPNRRQCTLSVFKARNKASEYPPAGPSCYRAWRRGEGFECFSPRLFGFGTGDYPRTKQQQLARRKRPHSEKESAAKGQEKASSPRTSLQSIYFFLPANLKCHLDTAGRNAPAVITQLLRKISIRVLGYIRAMALPNILSRQAGHMD